MNLGLAKDVVNAACEADPSGQLRAAVDALVADARHLEDAEAAGLLEAIIVRYQPVTGQTLQAVANQMRLGRWKRG